MQIDMRTILLIEENPDERAAIQRYLSYDPRQTYALVEASRGAEGLRACQEQPFDVILLDYYLPDMDGRTFWETLQQQSGSQELPVVYLIKKGSEEIALEASGRRTLEYIIKESLTPESLRLGLQAAIEKSALRQQIERQRAELERLTGDAREQKAQLSAEAAAHNKQQQAFQMIAENSLDIIARFDRDLRHSYINPAATRATGRASSDFLGKTNQELGMPAAQVEVWDAALEAVFGTGEERIIDFHFSGPDGSRWYQSKLAPERDETGAVTSVLAVARDVTALQQAHENLRRSEARARRLLESNIIGVIVAQGTTIVEANDAFLELIGARRDDLEQGHIDWVAMTPPEYAPQDERALQELRTRGVCTPFEKEYLHRDGHRVPILIGAAVLQQEPLQWVCFILDLSLQKQAVQERMRALQMAHQQTEEALHALLTVAQALVAPDEQLSPHKRVGSSWREAARPLLNAISQAFSCEGAAMVVLSPGTENIDAIALSNFGQQIERSILDRVRGEPLAQRFGNPAIMTQLREGKIVELDVSQPPYRGIQPRSDLPLALIVPMQVGNTLGGIITLYTAERLRSFSAEEETIARSMSSLAGLLIERERLFAEREEARARELAAQEAAQQMDAFLGIISHELKTPLTAIKGNLQLAERQLKQLRTASAARESESEKQAIQGSLTRALRQLDVQNRLVNDLIDVSRVQAERLDLRLGRCSLTQIVREAVEDQRQLDTARRIELHTLALEILVLADRERVGQVIANYLTNALKYSEMRQPIEVRVDIEGTIARVSVSDKGPGLSAEQQQHIWEQFYRVPEIEVKSGSGVGLGLGLFICKQLIERQGGQVGVESAPGQGSTFWFTLPRVPEE